MKRLSFGIKKNYIKPGDPFHPKYHIKREKKITLSLSHLPRSFPFHPFPHRSESDSDLTATMYGLADILITRLPHRL